MDASMPPLSTFSNRLCDEYNAAGVTGACVRSSGASRSQSRWISSLGKAQTRLKF